MAIDKAVDSSVLEAGLTTIADAIREKGGTSDTLAFPDAMAEAIAAIEAGGGNVVMGRITLIDTTVSQLEITHGLGCTPKLLLICAADNSNETYSSSSPYGQSFAYAVFNKTENNGVSTHLVKQQAYKQSNSYYGIGYIYGTELGTGIKYNIVANEQTIIWANRNNDYGFGKNAATFVWLAVKELPE